MSIEETRQLERTLKRVDRKLKKIVDFVDRKPWGVNAINYQKLVKMIDECYLSLHPEDEVKPEPA